MIASSIALNDSSTLKVRPEWLKDVNATVMADWEASVVLTVAGQRSGAPHAVLTINGRDE